MSDPKPPGAPPDPFGPMHANSLSLLENVRSHRAAGGNWAEVVALVAGMYIAAHMTSDGQQEQR